MCQISTKKIKKCTDLVLFGRTHKLIKKDNVLILYNFKRCTDLYNYQSHTQAKIMKFEYFFNDYNNLH